jgi:hypothetical protein
LQSHTGGFGKSLVDTSVLHGRAFQVSQSLDLLCYAKTLIIVDTWLLGLLVIRVVIFFFPQVTLECNQNELNARAVLCYLADPFRFYVLERVR